MKSIKKVIIILITVICLIQICSDVYAFNVRELTGTSISSSEINRIGGKTITVVSTIGSVASVVALIVIGIKYMLGSVEEKADYKKSMMPYFIGAVCVFAASGITGIIYKIMVNVG